MTKIPLWKLYNLTMLVFPKQSLSALPLPILIKGAWSDLSEWSFLFKWCTTEILISVKSVEPFGKLTWQIAVTKLATVLFQMIIFHSCNFYSKFIFTAVKIIIFHICKTHQGLWEKYELSSATKISEDLIKSEQNGARLL